MTSIIGFAHPDGKRSRAAGHYRSVLHRSREAGPAGLIVEVPDMEAFQKLMQPEAAIDVMRLDGVRPDTFLLLEKAPHRM
jgi:hypothetical protein